MKLTYDECVQHDLYLRKLSLGEVEGELSGYPSKDKPWLKYYTEEHIKAPLPNMTAYEYLKKMNINRLDFQAIDSMFGDYTYRELFTMIDATAASLYAMGISKGKSVLVMLPVMPHESFLFYGVDIVGAALCQVSPFYTTDEVCNALSRIQAELLFVFDDILTPDMEKTIYHSTSIRKIIDIGLAPIMRRDNRTISWEEFLELGKNEQIPDIHRDPADLLFIASTGGSTGEPKSVMLNDNSFNIAVHQYFNSDLNYQERDRWLRLWPLFSATAAVSNNHLPLCAGMNNILRSFPLNMEDFDKMVLDEQPEHLMLIPQLIDVLENSELLRKKDLSFIKTCGCGGIGITSQFERRVNSFFKEHNMSCILGYGWGCTENATSAAMRSNIDTTIEGTVGAPQVKTTVSVFDPKSGAELQFGEEGELCIKSFTAMMGYYSSPETTDDVLKKHEDGSIWIHTGDLGTVSKDGIITVSGRMTRMIFAFPTAKVYPQALENEISKISGVQEVVICKVPDIKHEGFYLPVCFIVPDNQYSSDDVQIAVRKFCEKEFPQYARPTDIQIREYLPLNRSGKPDIRVLERELLTNLKIGNKM